MFRAIACWMLLCVAALAQHEASVCLVRTADGSAGSGSLVEFEGRRFVLTNWHVIRHDASGGWHNGIQAEFTAAGGSYSLPFVHGYSDADIAAFDATAVPESIPAIAVAEDDRPGVARAYGHPMAGAMRVREVQHAPAENETYYETGGRPVAPLHFRGGSISGESGGPLINGRGRLVGVIWGGANDNIARCVPVGPIRRLLHRIVGQTQNCPGGGCQIVRGRPIYEVRPPDPPGGRQVTIEPPQPLAPVERNDGCPGCEAWRAEAEGRLAELAKNQSALVALIDKKREQIDRLLALDERHTRSLEEIAATIADLQRAEGPDLSPISGRLDGLEAGLAELRASQPSTYYALVADTAADYWPRLRDDYARTTQKFQGIRLAPPPATGVGRLPRLVAFQGGTPIGDIGGAREVSDALRQISEGRRPAFF